jgi:hypothetical protein
VGKSTQPFTTLQEKFYVTAKKAAGFRPDGRSGQPLLFLKLMVNWVWDE